MSKRTGSEVQANRETKKQKSDDSKLKTLLPELFENDPATNALEPAATDEEIKKLEEALGLTMPASYKQLLKFANGGQLRNKYFKLEDGTYAVIGFISGIYEDDEASVLKSKEICQELDLGSNYAILSGVTPEYFGLDFSTNPNEPEVVSILQENGGIQITKLAPNFETFLCGLEHKEEDCLYIALKSSLPVEQLEATVIAKLKEAGVEIKSEEELLQMRAEQLQNEAADIDTSDEDLSGEEDAQANPQALGARTNDVRDLGGSSESDDDDDGDDDDDVDDDEADGGELPEDFNPFDFASDEDFDIDDDDMRQCTVEAIAADEFPREVAAGFNLLFTYAMIKEGPYDDDIKTIKTVLEAIEGIEKIQVAAEPIDGQLVKHAFC